MQNPNNSQNIGQNIQSKHQQNQQRNEQKQDNKITEVNQSIKLIQQMNNFINQPSLNNQLQKLHEPDLINESDSKNIHKTNQLHNENQSSDQQKSNQFQFSIFKKTQKTNQINQIKEKQQKLQSEYNLNQQKNNQSQSQKNAIKQKKSKSNQKEKIRQMASSINPNEKVQSRKIPDKLLESYQEITLPKTQKKKQNNKHTKNTVELQMQKKLLVDQQMFASLPAIQGFCSVKLQNQSPKQTKYVIIKQTIMFPQIRKIQIKSIKKIKIFQKNESFFIKICAKTNQKEDQVFLLTIFANQKAKFAIFYKTFQFFSNILLRKILLKSIFINQHTEKFSKNQSLQYQGLLFKKDHFFSSLQKRKVKLQNNILYTYKGQKCSNQIKWIRQLWTRFDMLNGYLIIKMWHGYQKIQLGVPLCDFTVIDGKNNWLYGLVRLIKQKEDQN